MRKGCIKESKGLVRQKFNIGSRGSSELDQDENLAGRETDGIGIKRVMSESTPVQQGHDFATLTGTLNR